MDEIEKLTERCFQFLADNGAKPPLTWGASDCGYKVLSNVLGQDTSLPLVDESIFEILFEQAMIVGVKKNPLDVSFLQKGGLAAGLTRFYCQSFSWL
jgi:hypothetical protein